MSTKHDDAELDISDDDDWDNTTDVSEDETKGGLVPSDRTLRNINSLEERSWEHLTFRGQLEQNNTIVQLAVDQHADSPNEGLQEELRQANEKIQNLQNNLRREKEDIELLEAIIQNLKADLSREQDKNSVSEERIQYLETNLSREQEKNLVSEERIQYLETNLSREQEEHAKAQTDLQLSRKCSATYESLYKGVKDHNEFFFIENSLLLTELSALINPNELNIGYGKSLCLLGIQLQFSIKPGQPKNKIVKIQLQPENGSGCWEKQYSSSEDDCGTRKEIKLQLGIHGSYANIVKYLTKASIHIKVYAEYNSSDKYKEDGTGFSMDFNEVLKNLNLKSSIAIQGGQGFEHLESSLQGSLQLLFYSRDAQPPVAALSQIPAAEAHTDPAGSIVVQIQADQNPHAFDMEIAAQNNSRTNNPAISQLPYAVPSETMSRPLCLVDQTGVASNNSMLDSMGVVPVEDPHATINSVQLQDSELGISPSSNILELHGNFQKVPLDNNSVNYPIEQLGDVNTISRAEGNGVGMASETSPHANTVIIITTGVPRLVIAAAKQIAPTLYQCVLEGNIDVAKKQALEASHDLATSQEYPIGLQKSDLSAINPSEDDNVQGHGQQGPEIPVNVLTSDSTNIINSAVSHTQLQAHGSNVAPIPAPPQDGDETPKPYKCDQCGQRFQWDSSLSKHKRKHKEGEGKVPCSECNQMLSTGCSLLRHLRNVHKKDIPKTTKRPSTNKKYKKTAKKSKKN